MKKYCLVCNNELTIDNWYESYRVKNYYICKECKKNKEKKRRHDNPEEMKLRSRNYHYRKGGKSMIENKKCGIYLGIYISEQILSKIFKNVIKMPINNPGYDFICNNGYKIDVKSSCIRKDKHFKRLNNWTFGINHNKIPDYFLCLAFNNREDLNPINLWLIPGYIVNDKRMLRISESTSSKWDKYKIDKIDDIISYCNNIK